MNIFSAPVQTFVPTYPVYGMLPLPIYQGAVNEGIYKTQAPYLLAHHCALVAIALSVQGSIDVEKPRGGRVPVSLMSMIAASSGERKSTVDGIYLRAIREFDDKQRQRWEQAKEDHEIELEEWDIKRSELERAFRKAIQDGCGNDEAAKLTLREHRKRKPVPPKCHRILYQEATLPALMKGLLQSPAAGLISDEGKEILVGDIFNERSKLNSFWSGSPVTVDRVTSDSYVLRDVRLTTGIMVQPKAVEEFVVEKGESARDSGLLARMIVCVPRSTQGSRFVGNEIDADDKCRVFAERISELLERYVEAISTPGFKREVVKFTPEAADAWVQYFNFVEQQIQPGGWYAEASDHASKLADNVARVAAAFHYFEGFEGDISLKTFETARMLVEDASKDFMSLFVPGPPGDAEADLLEKWFYEKMVVHGRTWVAKSLIMNKVPNPLRRKAVLDPALNILVLRGRIQLQIYNRTCYIVLNVAGPPLPMSYTL